MALDARRNDAYAEALRQFVGPESVVLDLGAGTGIHGLIAARLGAKRVYLVEPEDILSVAEEIVRANGLGDRVRCFHGRIEDVRLPEQVDVIVSVLTGNFLLTEDLLPALFHARDTALKPGGRLIPQAATMEAVPVSAPQVHAKDIASWSVPQQGVDMSVARTYAANTIFYGAEHFKDASYLADPMTLHRLDLLHDVYEGVHTEATFEIARSGICHGVAGWFSLQLGDRWLSTSPQAESLHWSAAFLPLDPPMPLELGEQVSFSLDRQPYGDWTWRLQSATASRRHSTLLSAPMKASTLRKASLEYTPVSTADGHAAAYVLSRCDGKHTLHAIASDVQARYPERYPTSHDALSFVQGVVRRYA